MPDLDEWVLESVGGHLEVTLVVDVVDLKLPYTQLRTRGYNGSIGGPRLVVHPGDTMRLTLINSLLDINNTGVHNSIGYLNTTNMHTHGLHVSGMPPGDYVKWDVPPQTQRVYEYVIPHDHYPGHYWYHPHFHGSTRVQTGGGLFGSLVVDDPYFVLPPEYLDLDKAGLLPLRYIEIMNFEFRYYDTKLARFRSGIDLLQRNYGNYALNQANPNLGWNDGTNVNDPSNVLVNGAFRPKITVQQNVWTRFRILTAATVFSMYSMVEGEAPWETDDPACEWRLLSKDGNFLTSPIPRKFGVLPLLIGGRAEIIFRCTRPGQYNWTTIPYHFNPDNTTHDRLTEADWIAALGGVSEEHGEYVFGGVPIASFDVQPSSAAPLEPIPFRFNRPCYVGNAMEAPEDVIVRRNITMYKVVPAGAIPEFFLNGEQYQPENRIFEVPVGSVVEYTFSGVDTHPVHIHINPIQLSAIRSTSGHPVLATFEENPFAGFYREGDWHDLVHNSAAIVKGRQIIDRFTQDMVVHCHILQHEDFGMMNIVNVTGVEGTPGWATPYPIGHCQHCYRGAAVGVGRGFCYDVDCGDGCKPTSFTPSLKVLQQAVLARSPLFAASPMNAAEKKECPLHCEPVEG